MHENYERILKALNLEKWMTAKQLTRLLFQEEYKNESSRTAYDRISKNLQKLRKDKLLKSKSYGLSKEEGTSDYLWALNSGKQLREAEEELREQYQINLIPPKEEIRSSKYRHERDCAWVFVALAITEKLHGWTAHKKISKDIIPDRHAKIIHLSQYIERERGTQKKIEEKTINYLKYHRETGNNFDVLFLVNSEDKLEEAIAIFDRLKTTDHYQAAVFEEYINDPLNCLVTTAQHTFTLSNRLSNTASNRTE